jgi:glycosyltransferase involved in cell wall biosynthesis
MPTSAPESTADKSDDMFTPIGKLDRWEAGAVLGWAARSGLGPGRLTVELLVDGAPVASALAQQYRQDVERAGYGDGCYGFAIEIPAACFDAIDHSLEVREVVTGALLDGGPLSFRASASASHALAGHPDAAPPPRPKAIQGHLDRCRPGGITGWVVRTAASHFALTVELLVDDEALVRTVAGLHRSDLAAAGIGSGHHGFDIVPPDLLFDGELHEIRVREVSSGESVPGSPVNVRFTPCDRWDLSVDDDPSIRRQLADSALLWCEAAADDSLDDVAHAALVRLWSWLGTQPPGRLVLRAQVQLDRLTALRCEVKMDGLVGPAEIGGSVIDVWSKDSSAMALELHERGRAVATTESQADGRFLFYLPESALDDDVHRFTLRIVPMAGSLGAWSFLIGSSTVASSEPQAPIWDTLPAAMAARHVTARRLPTAVETARLALADSLPQSGPGDLVARDEIVRRTCALADALLHAGEWAEAQALYDDVVALDPGCIAALAGPVRCLMAAGEDRAATDRLHAAMQVYPDQSELHRLADDLAGRGRVHSVRTLAFYLPQYHPTPDNDEWWGRGFTEWTNVGGAYPLFDGHLQPRRPTSLGYYDLRLPEAANAQFELARRYGIEGFCYYYYWFEGRRILERPLNDLASGRTGPFPFCICWANEDWTRSWDGTSGEVLLAQNHSPESDFAFIQDLTPLLRHKDYVRVEGKPIVQVYRPDRLATPRETLTRWREWCRAEGIGEIYLCGVQSFRFNDPRPLGFDAAVEFPPHCPWDIYPDLQFLQTIDELPGRVPGFSGMAYDYQAFASASMRRPREPYALHRTAMVAWDNTARRNKAASIYHRFSVETFERWMLANARRAAVEQADAVCFVNAWNEWAEGSVMEPDVHFGYEILEATRRAYRLAHLDPKGTYWRLGRPAMPESRIEARQRVLLFGHDAFPSGAQTNLLNMARCLKRQLDTDVVILLIEGGALLPDYERVAPTYLIGKDDQALSRLRERLEHYACLGARKAICNTVITGDLMELLKQQGYRIVGLLHELPTLIESYGLQLQCWRFAAQTDAIVCASKVVADEFCNRYWPDPAKLLIAPQGIVFNRHQAQRDTLRVLVREELDLAPDCRIAIGCGYGDTRKGIDLFVQMAGEVARQCEPGSVAFIWVGALDGNLAPYVNADIDRLGLRGVFRVTGRTDDPGRYFIAGDLFALTSREDPFPSVVMEAFEALMPVVAFDGGGGYVDIVGEDSGALVPYLDVSSMTRAVLGYLRDPARRARVGAANHVAARERFGYTPYMRKLLALLADVPAEQVAAGLTERQAWFSDRPRPTITAIVPNYNYARYLELRLRTVIGQTLPPDEIVVLDDGSTDGSLDIVRSIAAESPIAIRIVAGETNSGNPFVQWAKGLAQAKGDLIWIAEADDYCEPTLLETLARELADDKVSMAWVDSVMVDEQGRSEGAQYKDYYARNYGSKWSTHFRMSGRELIEDCLLTENVLPNASAVLFRRKAAGFDLSPILQYRFSGDWWFWLRLAQQGDVVYRADPLNYHRRHSRSVMGDVLRAGASLLPETMDFYRRVAISMPESISILSATTVIERVNRLYEMFPELTDRAQRLAEHSELAIPYTELRHGLRKAISNQGRTRPDMGQATLVLSADALRPQCHGALVVQQLLGRYPALSIVLIASAPEVASFIESNDLMDVPVTVMSLATATEVPDWQGNRSGHAGSDAMELELRDIVGDSSRIDFFTHGLLAHCLVGAALAGCWRTWTLVAGADFNALLGQPPQESGVTLAGLRRALGACTVRNYLGESVPHAFARMAQEGRLASDRLPSMAAPRSRRRVDDDLVTLRIAGLALHASLAEWRSVLRLIERVRIRLDCRIAVRLFAWAGSVAEMGVLESEFPQLIELVQIHSRPTTFAHIADVALARYGFPTGAPDDEVFGSDLPHLDLFTLDGERDEIEIDRIVTTLRASMRSVSRHPLPRSGTLAGRRPADSRPIHP